MFFVPLPVPVFVEVASAGAVERLSAVRDRCCLDGSCLNGSRLDGSRLNGCG